MNLRQDEAVGATETVRKTSASEGSPRDLNQIEVESGEP